MDRPKWRKTGVPFNIASPGSEGAISELGLPVLAEPSGEGNPNQYLTAAAWETLRKKCPLEAWQNSLYTDTEAQSVVVSHH